jgi:hypothetical protein
MSAVVKIKSEDDVFFGGMRQENVALPEELRLRLLRMAGEALQALAKIDETCLTHQDQKRVGSAIDRLVELETQLAPVSVQLAPGMQLSKREKLVLVHIRRRGRVTRSDLRRALHHHHINSAALSDAVGALVQASIVAEHRELGRNGRVKTTYYVRADPGFVRQGLR